MSDADRADADAEDGDASAGTDGPPGGRPCPLCERPMYSRHCKYVCPEHGVVYDCADTFY
ncbi:HVO_2523 family zinc finger protein [Halorientalis halophila]|uniref:HVO_2523 family zinc finger protein n=1 Tax=Halorientalis halophila TaxID=3108499 RepID=UPI003AB6722B